MGKPNEKQRLVIQDLSEADFADDTANRIIPFNLKTLLRGEELIIPHPKPSQLLPEWNKVRPALSARFGELLHSSTSHGELNGLDMLERFLFRNLILELVRDYNLEFNEAAMEQALEILNPDEYPHLYESPTKICYLDVDSLLLEYIKILEVSSIDISAEK